MIRLMLIFGFVFNSINLYAQIYDVADTVYIDSTGTTYVYIETRKVDYYDTGDLMYHSGYLIGGVKHGIWDFWVGNRLFSQTIYRYGQDIVYIEYENKNTRKHKGRIQSISIMSCETKKVIGGSHEDCFSENTIIFKNDRPRFNWFFLPKDSVRVIDYRKVK